MSIILSISMIYTLINKTKNRVVSKKVKVASSFFLRFKGLMFRKVMDSQEALLFYKTPTIHTFFMRFPIDIVFLDEKKQIIRICASLKPGRAVFCCSSSVTIEFPAQHAAKNNLELGDILEIVPVVKEDTQF